jgi:Bacterial Ig-like domain (group 3)
MRRINRGRTLVLCLFASVACMGALPGMAQATPTGAPAITGTLQQGQPLTATLGTLTGTGPVTITSYQWQIGGVSVLGANGSTYTPVASDVGKTIDVVVTATDSVLPAATAASPATATVAGINTALPSIVGTAQQGGTLTVTNGVWTGPPTITPTISHQWESCTPTCAPIVGATAASYLLGPADVGHKIEVVETATYAGESILPPTATSAQTGVVTTSVPPAIVGTALPGQTLAVTQGTWPNSPIAVTDQWESCASLASCSPVGPSNSPTYTVAPSDIGHAIEVIETASYPAGAVQATSLATLTVGTLSNISPPGISGIAQQGQTLTAVHGLWNAAASVAYSYQWEDCSLTCTPIPNATGPSYVIQPGDVGQEIVVAESIGNGSIGALSSPTAVVTGSSGTSLAVFAPGNPVTNQTVTLVAAISSSSSNADPVGSVTFFDGSNAIQGCAKQSVRPTGQVVTVVCQANFPAGSALVSASYAADAASLISGSTSAPTTLSIGKDSTSTSLAVTKRVARGKPATYTATIVLPGSNSGPIQPTGSIEFLDAGKPIGACLNRPLRQLTATCTLKYRSKGSHRISAVYNGDSNFVSSKSPTTTVQIGKGSLSPVVLGFIKSTLGWTFYYHPTYTQVMALRAYGVIRGISILLTCTGGGCPFAELQTSAAASPRCSRSSTGACTSGGSINLLPAFEHHRLRPGAKITLRFIRPSWIGKYYSFTVRAGHAPVTSLKCVGISGRAGVGC